MSEHPILMQDEMVRAALAGTKNQTRRVLKPQPQDGLYEPSLNLNRSFEFCADSEPEDFEQAEWQCPYGFVGDSLWVREAWRCEELPDGQDGVRYRADDAFVRIANTAAAAIDWTVDNRPNLHWRPSIFMRRWAARLILGITHLRVERVQAISQIDAMHEGVSLPVHKYPVSLTGEAYVAEYRELWNKINLDPKPHYATVDGQKVVAFYEAFPWSLDDFEAKYPGAYESKLYRGQPLYVMPNPWVYVITFKIVNLWNTVLQPPSLAGLGVAA